MAKMDYTKASRAQHFQDSVRLAEQADRALMAGDRPGAPRATEKQAIYIQSLLIKAGRRELTEMELRRMSMAGASRFIRMLTT